MKLLMFNTREFWFRTFKNCRDEEDDEAIERTVEDALVIFIHIEGQDGERGGRLIRKAADNIVWLSRKTGRTRVVLHSFAHLSDSKSEGDAASDLLQALHQVLLARGLETTMTPFGYLNEFRIQVLGDSLAKVWKSL